MTYRGHVHNGVVVIDEAVALPEGAEVQLELIGDKTEPLETIPTLYEQLAPFVGAAKGLPPDLAANHDFYLHSGRNQ
jgi:hypothetical protein